MAKITKIQKEVNFALSCISIGCNKFYKDYKIDYKTTTDKLDGLSSILKGAYILNAISNLNNFNGNKYRDKFPVNIQDVLNIIENNTVDEWVTKYPFLKDYTTELSEISFSFLDEVDIGEKERLFKENSEYELYIKFNNDLNFSIIRELAVNDYEYAFSRVGIPTILEGNTLHIRNSLITIYRRLFNTTDINEKLIESIVLNYYTDAVNLRKYHHTPDGYAYCKNCGSFLQKVSRKESKFVCTFDVCRDKQAKFNNPVEIGGFVKNPTKILRYEVLRFVSYPSIEEWALYSKLKDYQEKGSISDLVLYFNKDACDISFKLLGERYALDLKEWTRPTELGKRISEENFKRNNKDARCFILIPDYLTKKSTGRANSYLKVLRNSIDTNVIKDDEILTVSKFLKQIKSLTS